jgi:hypothetical protein
MPDNKPMPPKDEESKKDTVRINLPPSVTGKPPQKPGSATQPVGGSDVTQPLVPPGPPPARPVMPDVTQPITPPGTTQPLAAPGAPSDEAKKETAIMGKPPATAVPKADTSRVTVSSSTSPTVAPESPRPTVKLRRETEVPAAATAPAPETAPAPKPPGPSTSVVTSGVDAGLALAAMVLSLAVVGYLAYLVFG